MMQSQKNHQIETDAMTSQQSRCVQCFEPIQPQARICPHCHAPQSPKRWKSFGEVLKWLGGITAVLSLIIGIVQLSGALKTMRERSQTVDALVRAAEVQLDMADYAGALMLIDEALDLEPGSQPARKLHLQVAMRWVRQFTGFEHDRSHSFNREDYLSIIDPLVPILHRGTADKNPSNAANVLAHIGWANLLRVIGGNKDLNPVEYFKRALDKDPVNAFAHVMWATMCATKASGPTYRFECSGCGNDYDDFIEIARTHYAAAVKSGQHRKFVNDIRLKTLLLFSDRSAAVYVIDLVQEMKKSDTSMSMENKYRAIETIADLYMSRDKFYRKETYRKNIHRVKISDTLSAVEWLSKGIDYKTLNREHRQWHLRVLMARVNELAGNFNKAIEMYRSVRLDAKAGRVQGSTFNIQTDIDKSLLHLLKIRRGSLGIRIRPIEKQLALNLGLQETEGALVEEVTGGGAAEKAGIKVDDVILKVNDISLKGDRIRYYDDRLRDLFGLELAGNVVEALIFRDGKQQALKVTLGEHDPSDESKGYSGEHYDVEYLVDRALYSAVPVQLLWKKVWLADLIDELREAFEVDSGIDGVVVLEDQESALRTGQVITEVDGLKVSSAAKIADLVKEARSSRQSSILFTLIDKGKHKICALRLISEEGK